MSSRRAYPSGAIRKHEPCSGVGPGMELATALPYVAERHQGVLVTLKRDERPQLSNVAYAVGSDGVLRVSVTAGRAKTANVRRDPRVSLYVGRPDFGAYVVIEGRGELSAVSTAPADPAGRELADLYRAVQGEHPDWDDFFAAMVQDRRLVLRLYPERAYGMLAG
jgi:PPOX class probable F420-dependent enzyme